MRAHGRQLGDWRNETKGTQELTHLISESAYEHWHRMLFARFLAENQLLLEPQSGVAVAIDEVKELAREQGHDWVVLAGEFAVKMLPQVFRQDDPVLLVQFAPEDRRTLEELLESLPAEVFTADDSLGWTYQFWQTERKNEVNVAGNKIGAEELPAVTQLFTEDYMVDFLLDNTLGAWYAGKFLAANPHVAENAQSESELRKAVALAGCPWKYLRFTKIADGTWTPASGTFDGWPKSARELKCLDPCMGSGHFVVAMFERLVALRIPEEKLDEAAAVAAVIRDNLFGLEIDPRCTQIAAFNLALAAWRRVGHCALPAMNLACSGLAPNVREADWLAVAGNNQKLQRGMERLYRLFKDAPVLGSLINPRYGESDLLVAGFHELQPLLEKALAHEDKDDTSHELAVAARGVARAAEILADQFTVVATNVPYLSRNKQDEPLRAYCDARYPRSKTDLATVFVERCENFLAKHGSTALVVPRIWMTYTAYYENLRRHILTSYNFDLIGLIGKNGFETIGGEIVDVALISLSKRDPTNEHTVLFLDASDEARPTAKASALHTGELARALQKSFLTNPGITIALQQGDKTTLLSQFIQGYEGLSRGDVDRFDRQFWELPNIDLAKWQPLVNSSTCDGIQSGLDLVFYWEDGRGALAASDGARVQGIPAWNRRAVFVSRTHLRACLSYGRIHAQNGVALVPREKETLLALLEFCRSEQYRQSVRALNQKLIKPTGVMAKVPFDLAHWQRVAAEKYPNGLPKPFSSDPAQWLFTGHPIGADHPLHVAVARLLAYQWPRQTGSSFPDCAAIGPDGLERIADADGIVPISPAKGEGPAAERLRELLAAAYGNDWSAARQEELLAQVGYAGASLEEWLRDGFFEQHCALFHNRPFLWHIWDGLEDGFHALVNYHRLAGSNGEGRRTLEKLAFSYLGDWVTRQKAEQKAGKEGADGKLAAALHLQEQLRQLLIGEPPVDLFVRWKPLHEQAIGWDPEINDGVRMNIRPFMAARTLSGKSIFRKMPKIKWEKDRGNEPERARRDFPWFWGWDEEAADFKGSGDFDGKRWNDLHYSNAVKIAARERHKEKGQ
ncbi:MAG: Eco57I restriction-modification methylase domain-containing protein [Gemmatimonadales bacterium]